MNRTLSPVVRRLGGFDRSRFVDSGPVGRQPTDGRSRICGCIPALDETGPWITSLAANRARSTGESNHRGRPDPVPALEVGQMTDSKGSPRCWGPRTTRRRCPWSALLIADATLEVWWTPIWTPALPHRTGRSTTNWRPIRRFGSGGHGWVPGFQAPSHCGGSHPGDKLPTEALVNEDVGVTTFREDLKPCSQDPTPVPTETRIAVGGAFAAESDEFKRVRFCALGTSASELPNPDPQVFRTRGLRDAGRLTSGYPHPRGRRVRSVTAGLDGRDGERGSGDDRCGDTHESPEAPPDAAESNPTGLEQERENAEHGVDAGCDQQ